MPLACMQAVILARLRFLQAEHSYARDRRVGQTLTSGVLKCHTEVKDDHAAEYGKHRTKQSKLTSRR